MRRPSPEFIIILAFIIIAFIIFIALPSDKGITRGKIRHEILPQSQIRALSLALERYKMENGDYPTTEQGLKALLTKPTIPPTPEDWAGPYLKSKPLDPWRNPYQYCYPSRHNRPDFDIWSLGPDGKDGTMDDITNWEKK